MSHRAPKKNSNYRGYQPPETPEKKRQRESRHVRMSGPQKVMAVLTFAIFLGMLIWAASVYSSLPSQIATGFQDGQITDKSGRGVVFFYPLGGAFTCFLLTMFNAFPKLWRLPVTIPEEKYDFIVYGVIRTLVAILSLEIAVTFLLLEISAILVWMYPDWLLLTCVGIMFLTLFVAVFIGWRSGKRDIDLHQRPRDSGIGRHL